MRLTAGEYCEFRMVTVSEAEKLCAPEHGFVFDRWKRPAVEVDSGALIPVMKVYSLRLGDLEGAGNGTDGS